MVWGECPVPKWGHHSSASGSDRGHRNYDSFARAPLVDLGSLVSSLCYHLGQIWVKALLEPEGKVEKLQRKYKLSLTKVVGHSTTYSHWNIDSPLTSISCRCTTTISSVSVKRGYPPSRSPNWSFWPAALKSDFRTTELSACLPSLHCLTLSLESHKHSIWVFFPVTYSDIASNNILITLLGKGCSQLPKSAVSLFTLDSRKTSPEPPSF